MIFKPVQLGRESLDSETLAADKAACRRFGPCGVGKQALYLNSFYIDRRYYVPFSGVTRVFKRVAMSKGGFSRKGVFASIPYLVVEYDGGKEKQCNFKYEEQVDQLLACLAQERPEIKRVSAQAEERLARREREKAAQVLPELTEEARASLRRLEEAEAFLEKSPALSLELSQSARRKREFLRTKPSYRWVALAVTLMGAAALLYGAWALLNHSGGFGIYFLLFGLAALFMFSGANILPTAKNNRKTILTRADRAEAAMEEHLRSFENFPLPARYAHPVVLRRMRRAIEAGLAATPAQALEAVKAGLKALNASVEVSQEEYDEVVAVKALFLNHDYH